LERILKPVGVYCRQIPADFFNRKLDDLGCGDGKVTVLLADLFRASKPVRGFEIDANLVKRANEKGIVASVCDLEKMCQTESWL